MPVSDTWLAEEGYKLSQSIRYAKEQLAEAKTSYMKGYWQRSIVDNEARQADIDDEKALRWKNRARYMRTHRCAWNGSTEPWARYTQGRPIYTWVPPTNEQGVLLCN